MAKQQAARKAARKPTAKAKVTQQRPSAKQKTGPKRVKAKVKTKARAEQPNLAVPLGCAAFTAKTLQGRTVKVVSVGKLLLPSGKRKLSTRVRHIHA